VCLKIREKKKLRKYNKKNSKVSQIWARSFKYCGKASQKNGAKKTKKIKKLVP
jgi:hypothetical protein